LRACVSKREDCWGSRAWGIDIVTEESACVLQTEGGGEGGRWGEKPSPVPAGYHCHPEKGLNADAVEKPVRSDRDEGSSEEERDLAERRGRWGGAKESVRNLEKRAWDKGRPRVALPWT